MTFICNICEYEFTQKHALMKHLSDKRCKSELVMDYIKLNLYIKDQDKIIEEKDKISENKDKIIQEKIN